MWLYWLVWPQGCDDYLGKNCSIDIDFWSGLDAATTFFLGHHGLALTNADGASANCNIDFWSGPGATTTFFLGCPGLALTDADGVGAFNVDSTIGSIVASCCFFLRVARAPAHARCQFACGKHQESRGSTTSAWGESRSTSCPRILASFQWMIAWVQSTNRWVGMLPVRLW